MSERPFSEVYEDWMADGRGRNHAVEPELKARYREAWGTGETYDRFAVLYYLMLAPEPDGFDLVVDALRQADEEMAGHVGAIASVLIGKGFDLGDGAEEALLGYADRFPEQAIFAQVALSRLSARDEGG